MKITYDTLVCEAVKRNPLEFVDILHEAAKKPAIMNLCCTKRPA